MACTKMMCTMGKTKAENGKECQGGMSVTHLNTLFMRMGESSVDKATLAWTPEEVS